MNKEKKVIRLGTRKSPLAMAQARLAAEAIEQAFPELTAELVPIVTRGDRILDRPLVEFGGKGAFISEFERALLEGRIDGAVHRAPRTCRRSWLRDWSSRQRFPGRTPETCW